MGDLPGHPGRHVCPEEGQQPRPAHPSPRPVAPARGLRPRPRRAWTPRPRPRLGCRRPRTYRPPVLPPGAAGAEPSALALPPSPQGRRRFLPDASRRPRLLLQGARGGRGQPGGRPAARREDARAEPGGGGQDPQAGQPLLGPPRKPSLSAALSSPRTPSKARVPAPPCAQSSGDSSGSRPEAGTLRCFPLLSCS